MKLKTKSACLLFTGVAMLASPAMAVTTANGDLLVGFFKVVSGVVQPDTYIFNLGEASLYRENTLTNVAVSSVNTSLVSSNINADLNSVFGTGWANDNNVYWSIFGGYNQTTSGVVNGDVAKTPYISIPVSTYSGVIDTTTQPIGSTFGAKMDSNGRSAVSNQIQAINAGSNGTGVDVGNDAGAKIAASGNLGTSVDSFFQPFANSGLNLTLGTELRGLFGAGPIAGSTNLEGALDVYRYVNSTTTSGVDLSTGLGSSVPTGNAGLGVGQYIGTFTLSSTGELGIGQISAVPEPSGALALGLIGTLAGLGYRCHRSNKLA